MVKQFLRPRDAAEALAMLTEDPEALALAGGTYLLTGQFKDRELKLVSVSGILPKDITKKGEWIEIGAGATFQDLVDSAAAPEALRRAARGMADRNIRNRATLGGNLGADKSCSSLLPVLLALDAELELGGSPSGRRLRLEDWRALPKGPARGLVLKALVRAETGRRSAYKRYARTACDLSLLSAAVSFRLEAGSVRGLRIAMGGLGPAARRFPELEALFEGSAPRRSEEIEAAAAPLLFPVADLRGSAEFKRLRAAALLSEAFAEASVGLAALGGPAEGGAREPKNPREAPL